jgi:peptide/nickel transport system substrate-binding protein
MKKALRKIGLLGVAGLLVSIAPPVQAAPITATYSNIAETATLDPAIAFSSDGFIFVRNVYEGLLEYKPGTMTLQGVLAKSWKASADGLSFTFDLRPGVKFHDGSPLNAAGVVTALNRIQAVNQGPATMMTNVSDIVATSASQVKITMKTKDFTFLGKLPKLPIVSAAAIEKNKTADDPWAKTWFATNEAGSGPYVLDNWQRNQAITITKNSTYWRPFGAKTPTKVVLRVDPDITTAMQLLSSGQVDFMGAVGPDDSAAAAKNKNLQVLVSPSYYIQFMPMNVTKGPLKDVRVRKAISLAFDYKGMIDFYKGYAEAASGPLPNAFSPVLAKSPKMAQNIAEAKKLLAAAGYKKGFTMTYLGLKGLSYEEFAGTLLQSNLKQIGIKLEQTLVPWPQMAEAYKNQDTAYDISFLNMSAFTNDAGNFLGQSYSSAASGNNGGYNWSFYEDPAVDKKIAGLSQIKDDAARMKATLAVNKTIKDKYLAIYVAEPQLAQPVRKGWTGFYDSLDANYTVRFFYTIKKS